MYAQKVVLGNSYKSGGNFKLPPWEVSHPPSCPPSPILPPTPHISGFFLHDVTCRKGRKEGGFEGSRKKEEGVKEANMEEGGRNGRGEGRK